MNIAAVQIESVLGNIEENIKNHCIHIEQCIAMGADLVVFPELSLTGYMVSHARSNIVSSGDLRLAAFQEYSNSNQITICMGAPVERNGLNIGMLIFQPEKKVRVYCKQYLHEDEKEIYTGGEKQLVCQIESEKIAPAICYEIFVPQHVQNANAGGATLYLASVAKSTESTNRAHQHLPVVAKEYKMPVVMCNGVGRGEGLISAGGSRAWAADGNQIGSLPMGVEGVLFCNL